MEYSAFREREVTRGHLDRLRDQRCLVIVVHRPPDDLACRAVNDCREIQPSFPGLDVRYIADHFLAWPAGGEVAADQIRDRPGGAVLLGQRPAPRPGLAGLQAQFAHQLADGLVVGGLAAADQDGVHAPVPVLLVVVLEYCLNLELEHSPSLLRLAFRSFPPVVVAGFRYAEPFAHLGDSGSLAFLRRGCVLSIDECVFLAHRCSLAKYAAAFFRKAFSISRSRTRLSSTFTRSDSGMPTG